MMANVTGRIFFYGGLWLIGALTLIFLHSLGVQSSSIANLLRSLGFLMGIGQGISIAQVKHWGDLSTSDVSHPRTREKLIDHFSRRRTTVLTRLVVSLIACVLAGFASFGADIGKVAGFWILAFGLGCIYLLVITSVFFVKDIYDYWDAKGTLERNAQREKSIADQISRITKVDSPEVHGTVSR